MNRDYIIHTDGASEGKAGPQRAAAAFVAKAKAKGVDEKFLVLVKQSSLYLSCPVNQAEITAIYMAVQFFVEVAKGEDLLEIRTDSEWSVACLSQKLGFVFHKKYVTVLFPEIFGDIARLYDPSRMKFTWIPREANSEADKLAKATKVRGW